MPENPTQVCYAVSHGSYSEYRVVAIFTTEENANKFLTKFPSSDDAFVEEFPLNPQDGVPPNTLFWFIRITRTGDIIELTQKRPLFTPGHRGELDFVGFDGPYTSKYYPTWVNIFLWAPDEKGAAKAATEHRARAVACGDWDRAFNKVEQKVSHVR